MNWKKIEKEEILNEIKEISKKKKALIFKHSSRCSISATALNRLERSWKNEEMDQFEVYFLDLIQFRQISAQIATEFNVRHESPQVLVIENGQVIYDNSHFGIDYQSIKRLSGKEKII